MKLDAKHLFSLFGQLKTLLGEIDETIRYGESVDETVMYLTGQTKEAISLFAMQHLTPPKKETTKEHWFLKSYDKLHDRATAFGGGDLSPAENGELFMAKFYLFLKRAVQAAELPINCSREILVSFIEDNLVMGSKYEYGITTDYDRYALKVEMIIADEIIAHRKKNPQIVMSLDVAKPNKSAKLIDII